MHVLISKNFIAFYRGGITSVCKKGYKGVLCSQCEGWLDNEYFAKAGMEECVLCDSVALEALKVTALLIGFILYLVLLVLYSLETLIKLM